MRSLNYLTITLSDISFPVIKVGQFIQAPWHLHLATICHIVSYLQGTSTQGLFFLVDSPIHLVAYSDDDWVGCSNTRCSITSWFKFIGTFLFSWKSKK